MSEVVVGFLDPSLDAEYDNFLSTSEDAMFTHSRKYRDFLLHILDGSEQHYVVATQDSKIIAALPLIASTSRGTTVINSLPFFGSHGGLIARTKLDENVKAQMSKACLDLYKILDAVALVLVETPFARNSLEGFISGLRACDARIGQITLLPNALQGDLEQALFQRYHKKTRNMVRKGMNSDFVVEHGNSKKIVDAIYEIHFENITNLGGVPKPKRAFSSLSNFFDYNTDYRIYVASVDDRIVSALLVFYFKDTVEYFVPATVEAYRGLQPMSLLIHTAMFDAISQRSSKYWNWGGTWESQEGVYRFKNRWGASDHPYRYFCVNELPNSDPDAVKEVAAQFPFYYVAPFT